MGMNLLDRHSDTFLVLYTLDRDVLILQGNNTWSELVTTGELPENRSAHSGLLLDNKMLIFGGWNGAQQFNDLFCLDTSTLSF
jgi:outer membrane protein assembly factor BamB